MNGKEKILLVEDDVYLLESCKQLLENAGYKVADASSPKGAESILLREKFDLVITDLKMPDGGGQEMIRVTKSIAPGLPIILITAYPTVNSAIDSFKSGVVDYLIKPFTNDQMLRSVSTALKMSNAKSRGALSGMKPFDADMPQILGNSRAVKMMLGDIRRLAPLTGHVLVYGETGAGKEYVSKAIHRFSRRASQPMVNLNCAALPETLLESEIFGYEKGAFTDAKASKPGLLEQANGGTLFLDEIGEMSLTAQAKLLRVIEQKKCKRLGGTKIYDADVRVVAATNKDLKEEIQQKKFREDLFYRISTLEIKVPPLRDREDDISLLAISFLNKLNEENVTKNFIGFSDEALEMLSQYQWPGNIRELQNVIHKLFAYSIGPLITEEDIIHSKSIIGRSESYKPELSGISSAVQEFEKDFIENALKQHGGNISRTALSLGIHRTTLQRLIKRFKISAQV